MVDRHSSRNLLAAHSGGERLSPFFENLSYGRGGEVVPLDRLVSDAGVTPAGEINRPSATLLQ